MYFEVPFSRGERTMVVFNRKPCERVYPGPDTPLVIATIREHQVGPGRQELEDWLPGPTPNKGRDRKGPHSEVENP